ncbi:universal stress protein [Mycobacterium sp. smrl_JER01]|uniref:universal stress protein n=1 Tax=Mycobacterium sp. smrl_JER01 TaxID=3402633 RepID=UPI003AC7ACB8
MADSSAQFGVVVGVDGSQESGAALRWAAREAQLFGMPLTVVYIIAPTVVTWPMVPLQDTVAQCQRENAEETLSRARTEVLSMAAASGQGIEVRTEVRYSSVLPALVEVSKDAQLVVVGSRGMGTVSRLVLGSVSDGLLHHAHGPVTVVHTKGGRLPDASAPVVVGIDGSPVSEAATAVAFDEAARRRVDLVTVHVWSDSSGLPLQGRAWRDQKQYAEEVLAERLAGWQEQYPDVRIHRHVEFDEPARHLIGKSCAAQLVVLGSHGRGGFSGMLLGSVSSAVAHSVDIPVTVVRPR